MIVRRRQLAPAAVSLAALAATPAFGQQTNENVKWRLTSSFPKSLDTLFGASATIARVVGEMTDGKFQLNTFAAGEIVPGLQVLDAVSNGTVECGHTYTGYYIGKNPSFIFDGSLPFGLTPRMHNAWMMFGDGKKLMDEVYESFNIVALPAGQTGGQMLGWFRKELKTPADFNGLKIRTAGFGGKVFAKLGAVPQQIAGGEIYPAMERGTLDAAEWVGPYDDEKLGFNKVAPYYYYPGWWEGGPQTSAYVSLSKWNELPKSYKAIIETASALAQSWMLSKYDAENPKALRELVAGGTKLLPYPQAVMEAAFNAANELYAELSAKNPRFKKVYDGWRQFRNEEILWFRVAEGSFDNFMARMSAAAKL